MKRIDLKDLKLLFLVLIALGAPLCARAFDEQIFTTNTLFIEAEDADYAHGTFVTGVKIGMDGPYAGGSYTNLGDINDSGFDWNFSNPTAPNGQVYRINTLLSAGKPNGSAGNNRGTFVVTNWWTLGWNSEGDWMNYTRVFPSTPQDYFVFGHLASGGNPIGVEIDQVTSGFGQADVSQVKKPLGYIRPGRATAGWDSMELFPMLDTNGAVITINLTGTNTLRALCMTNGFAEDMDYFAFVPVTVPLFGANAQTRDRVVSTLQDTPSIKVNTNTLAFTLNGTPITAATINNTNGLTTVTFNVSPILAQGATNSLSVTYSDTASKSHTASVVFVVNTFITLRTIFIEAEDADYAHGQFVTTQKIGMDGPYPGGSYTNLGDATDLDFDWHATGPNGQVYRAATGLSAGKPNGTAGSDRGYFQVTQWWTLGWNNGGDWANFTRPFPVSNQWYEAYAHLASGGSAIDLRLDQITAGVGQETTNQVRKTLGHFAPGRATAGWDNLEVFPLLTGPGGSPTVVNFNGTTTLRVTHVGAEDCDYYAFVPVTLPVAAVTINTQPQSATIPQNNTVNLSVGATTSGKFGITYQWKANGTVIPGATSPSFTSPPLALTDSGIQYTVDISSPGAPTVTSQAAVITVIKDTTPPTVVSAGSLIYSNTTEIGVIFNKPMLRSTLVPGNFTLDGGATVSAARYVSNSSGFSTFTTNGTKVPDREQGAILTVSSLNPATAYHLTVKNVSDFLTNTLTSQTVPVAQSTFTWVSLGVTATNVDITVFPNDVGLENDALAVGTNSFNLVNGGNAFWGTEDDITMVYEAVTNDFDKTTQVEWNDPSSNWARAGISAREDVIPTNAVAAIFGGNPPRYQMVISDPQTKFDGTAANDAYETNRRLNTGAATTSSNGGGNPQYPGSFVRLKRVGQMISMFYSTNSGIWWRPLGTTDFGDPLVSDSNMPPVLLVGPTLGVENGNILGQGGTIGQQGSFAARFRNYGNMVQKPRGAAVVATVGLSFGANEAGAQLSPSDVAGVDAVAQSHWNNIFGNAPAGVTNIVEEKAGAAVPTSISLSVVGCPNTWASQGPRGEENGALMTGNDAVLMTGFLDTGNATTTQVLLPGLPSDLTGPGYDVVVYAGGGVGARGGAYRVTDGGGVTLRNYVAVQAPNNPTVFTPVVPDPSSNAIGSYIVFTNLTASSIIVEGTTMVSAFSGTPRAPINAIQLVSPAGLLGTTTTPKPTVSIATSGGKVTITFTGTLESSTTANGTYTPVSGAISPYTVPTSGAPATFFRAKQ